MGPCHESTVHMNRLEKTRNSLRRRVPVSACPQVKGRHAGCVNILALAPHRSRSRLAVRWITEQPFVLHPEWVFPVNPLAVESRPREPLL